MKRALAALLLLVAVALPAAAQSRVPADRMVAILSRALAYDRNLAARAGQTVVVAVLYAPNDPTSARVGDEVRSAFKGLEKLKLQGKPFQVLAAPYTGIAATGDLVEKNGVDALFLGPGLDADLAAISAYARGRKLTTMTGEDTYLQKGVALGVLVEEGKPRIVVNLNASREEGASFSSELMQLAKVIK